MIARKVVLHVGCGVRAAEKLHPAFRGSAWREVRLDIDPRVQPDLVASITDMGVVADGSVDAVYSAHNLEHLYAHEVGVALCGFRRVLRPGGQVLMTLPDLQAIARLVVEGRALDAAYMSPMGPVTPLDMLYGFGPALAGGQNYMAHHTGFTAQSLLAALSRSGFAYGVVQREPDAYCLWAIGFASVPSQEELALARQSMLPPPAKLGQLSQAA